MALAKKLNIPDDSPLRKADDIPLPFPPPPPPSHPEEESESESEDVEGGDDEGLIRKSKEAVGAKSPSLNEQVLDLTQDNDGDEVIKEATPEQGSSDIPQIGKSVDETLAEIDAEIAADEEAEMSRPRPPSKGLASSSSKPNQLIVPPPLESITQSQSLEMVNRYQTLGNIHRPDYSSTLASDPFASSHSVSVTSFPVNPIKPSRSEILEIVQEEFPPDQYAPTPALAKAQQNPTTAISQGSQPSLPPVNLGSPSSSGPKPKSKAVATQPAQSKPKSKSKVKAKPISTPAQPKVKSKSKSKSSKEDMIQLAHQLLNQAKTQSTDSDSSEEGSEHAHSSEESTNQCSGPEFQDAQDPFA
ncbi:histone H3.v1-like [Camellia sinensis]|uniref:histone H3.v1-like n=1 Tax=Camellia sinensis TaxID=4442 RepID=UPI0010368285|nr:histone H3.v1-like [Camellia sinensis]